MTPKPPTPSSDDGKPLPPRHRPILENLTKDTTELDLWAFEDDLEQPEAPPGEAPRGVSAEIPAPRERRPAKTSDPAGDSASAAGSGGDQIRMDVMRSQPKNQPSQAIHSPTPENEFDDLENWDDIPKLPVIEELPDEPDTATEPLEAASPAPEVVPTADGRDAPAGNGVQDDEINPARQKDAKPVPLRPHLGLSKVERAGLIALAAMLLVGGLFAYIHSIKRLPTDAARASTGDFPLKGGRITVKSATTYWRQPVSEGPEAETFRRGTVLLPVLTLETTAGTGAIRVLFRNEQRAVIGDAVTRTIRGAGQLEIPATAGFDDIGMHAAYRTGGTKPWTVEVFEADSETAAGRDFNRLFEINISTDRR
jgi:hypothetical protein